MYGVCTVPCNTWQVLPEEVFALHVVCDDWRDVDYLFESLPRPPPPPLVVVFSHPPPLDINYIFLGFTRWSAQLYQITILLYIYIYIYVFNYRGFSLKSVTNIRVSGVLKKICSCFPRHRISRIDSHKLSLYMYIHM